MVLISRVKIDPKIKSDIKKRFQKGSLLLCPNATSDNSFLRRTEKKDKDFLRLPYSRDSDRILHSKAYSRYIDKTQVFFLVDNDHITHRVLHVQLVSKVARTIGRALGLNEDLIEAISLGHDIGHVPYGHLGERILSDLCKEYKIGGFFHNAQAIQFLDTIENLNLTFQVLDGILCHNGEVNDWTVIPDRIIDAESFDSKLKKINDGEKIIPSTYEGCVVRFADNIAYLGRDLQDAIELKLLTHDKELKKFPKSCKNLFKLHNEKNFSHINWYILDTLVKDVINSSHGTDKICFSRSVSESVTELKKFNTENIYYNPKLKEENSKIEFMFKTMFETFLKDFKENKTTSPIFTDMCDLKWISPNYKKEVKNKPEILVRDYIAGMTDRYFDKKFSDIMSLLPKRRAHF
jgi:dGTPase